MNYLKLFLKGILVGIANIIPGVSGGTIAVVLRIFDEMIEAINNFYKDLKKYLPFLIPLGLGAVTGIVVFSKLIETCLTNFSFQTNLFFVGLVCGSIPLIYSKASSKAVKPWYYIVTAIAFAFVVGISFLKEPTDPQAEIIVTIPFMLKMLIFGAIASAAMVIPGISGSFVMMLLGIYYVVLGAVSGLTEAPIESIKILAPTGVGIILGILVISKIIEILLQKAFSVTYFAILGLILSSIFVILKDPITYQSYPDGLTLPVIIVSVITFAVGFVIALILGKE